MPQIYRSSGTTGKRKIIYTDIEMIKRWRGQMAQCFKDWGIDENSPIKNTYNLISSKYPNAAYLMASSAGEITHINNYDCGNLDIEEIKEMMLEVPPHYIVGTPQSLENLFPQLMDNDYLSELKMVVSTIFPLTKTVEHIVNDILKVKLQCVYGQNETGAAFHTKGDYKEGFLTEVLDSHIEINPMSNEIVVYNNTHPKGFRTGDMGVINKYGKLDLTIARIKEKEKFCK